ncbi:hypothetical protein [Rhizobium straminoryzae]|uniref:Uncharacterized protein n=1 Tax=Rhizobium straminoryzae TaxID=1387186 RepID=A0A549TDJ4_9HYPH|nr:hypothetical protein [Rhizobium straminoryzae]TRL40124.1 hypothetical protein FNA46_07595 [Rhizobium straminoryzae]
MIISKSVAVPQKAEDARNLDTAEMIDRMAAELRARSDTDLPHSFYVAQVRGQLAGRKQTVAAAAPDSASWKKRAGEAHPSVFHAWALSE